MTNKEFEVFQTEKIRETLSLSGAAVKLMWSLLYKWYGLKYPKSFRMTDEAILEISGVKSRSALRAAKKKLQEAGLIKYTPSYAHGGTTYYITGTDEKGEES